jgi:hypothetical protein
MGRKKQKLSTRGHAPQRNRIMDPSECPTPPVVLYHIITRPCGIPTYVCFKCIYRNSDLDILKLHIRQNHIIFSRHVYTAGLNRDAETTSNSYLYFPGMLGSSATDDRIREWCQEVTSYYTPASQSLLKLGKTAPLSLRFFTVNVNQQELFIICPNCLTRRNSDEAMKRHITASHLIFSKTDAEPTRFG